MSLEGRVVVAGAGPGGVAAVRRLRERAGGRLELVLIEREERVWYLPGTVPVALGDSRADDWSAGVRIEGVRFVVGEAVGFCGGGVELSGGGRVEADAVIAAPGLHLETGALSRRPGLHAFWDPAGAARAAGAVRELREGVVAVVISSLPYRCPPAPYGLAMQLSHLYRSLGRGGIRVVMVTPEEEPLAALGERVSGFIRGALLDAGVELATGFELDLEAADGRELRSAGGESLAYDLALAVPPHGRSPLLRELPGGAPVVEVSPVFETSERGLFVVGDAAATPLPRAADAASAAGRTAADAVLERLGLTPEEHLPRPECYIGHGGGRYSKISLSYPGGLPPEGRAAVSIGGPSEEYGREFGAAFERWRALRS
ncbi:pyridine nucleotide-disulfide oxidoreductase [Rubrobacter taiwanensis]|uniref:Pyridine nucleotide-disulfide oxidoreductase n=1 Tax=Rubrobacter taiwanensis TaxID=185139 RepID=A0A4V2NWC9_9ACTN|nr:pyridine nucleotide-disulfide oxidoreductase [Rubrobacter taiwanensis]TCJ16882.1 pyridine nucleotide-disulfide oxidoreductase [Rubrobacter taiwanensis]